MVKEFLVLQVECNVWVCIFYLLVGDYFAEFSQAFPFWETPDQMWVINEVMDDLNVGKFMDWLVCGDVGYGKTEVAMRAVFRAILDNK